MRRAVGAAGRAARDFVQKPRTAADRGGAAQSLRSSRDRLADVAVGRKTAPSPRFEDKFLVNNGATSAGRGSSSADFTRSPRVDRLRDSGSFAGFGQRDSHRRAEGRASFDRRPSGGRFDARGGARHDAVRDDAASAVNLDAADGGHEQYDYDDAGAAGQSGSWGSQRPPKALVGKLRGELVYGLHAAACVVAARARTVHRAFLRDADAIDDDSLEADDSRAGAAASVSLSSGGPGAAGGPDASRRAMVAALRAAGVPMVRADKDVLLRLAREEGHQGVVLDVSPLLIDHLPPPPPAALPVSSPPKSPTATGAAVARGGEAAGGTPAAIDSEAAASSADASAAASDAPDERRTRLPETAAKPKGKGKAKAKGKEKASTTAASEAAEDGSSAAVVQLRGRCAAAASSSVHGGGSGSDDYDLWEGVDWGSSRSSSSSSNRDTASGPSGAADAAVSGAADAATSAHTGNSDSATGAAATPTRPRHRSRPRPPRLLLALDGLTDPHNVGAVLRSALLLAADGVIMTPKRSPPLNGTVSRTSAGALELLAAAGALRYTTALAASLQAYRARGWRVLGADAPPASAGAGGGGADAPPASAGGGAADAPPASAGAGGGGTVQAPSEGAEAGASGADRSEAAAAKPAAAKESAAADTGPPYVACSDASVGRFQDTILVLGSEGSGMRPSVRAACDALVFIPTSADQHGSEAPPSKPGADAPRTGAAAEVLAGMREARLVESLNVSNAAAVLLYALRPRVA